MTRKLISSLQGECLGKILPNGSRYDFYNRRGKLLFTVRIDDIFDKDGNYFEDDLPPKAPQVLPYRVQYRYKPDGKWKFARETHGTKHLRFATPNEARSYCDKQMERPGRLPAEEWKVV